MGGDLRERENSCMQSYTFARSNCCIECNTINKYTILILLTYKPDVTDRFHPQFSIVLFEIELKVFLFVWVGTTFDFLQFRITSGFVYRLFLKFHLTSSDENFSEIYDFLFVRCAIHCFHL